MTPSTPARRLRNNFSLGCLLLLLLADPCPGGEPSPNAPLPAEEAAATMQVPHGFSVQLFAGEPHVQQPIGFCIDDRGRLWVAEAYNYPHHGPRPGDRILIFEDQDGDGRFDKRTLFYDQLNYVTGIEVGFGGVWVMSPPNFYFIADQNQDDNVGVLLAVGSGQVVTDRFSASNKLLCLLLLSTSIFRWGRAIRS